MGVPDHNTPILVVGAGPVGLLTALTLAHNGVPCMLIERNFETTRWPKMDITNVRSMELLRILDLADGLREQGVPQNFSFDVIFSTGLGEGGEKIATWDLPSPDAWRQRISQQNDGSMPLEPYQRCSQVVFEAWLKPICEANPLIQTFFGYRFEELKEEASTVISTITDVKKNEKVTVKSDYVVACDGAGSRVRRSAGLKITGGPVPIAMYLVHFKSRDLQKLQSQGQFWHIFFTAGGAIISQDEDEIWTAHLPMSLEEDTDKIDPAEVVYKLLGSNTGRCPVRIDEILVKSVWRPNLVVADSYRSEKGRVFLSGDSAHQNIPTGGYGMNMGVADAFDIGWKLAAVVKGYGGPFLLESYEMERRPVALRNVERSGQHQAVHWEYCNWVKRKGDRVLLSNGPEGKELKWKIKEYVTTHDGENKDHGIELGYRHHGSPVILTDEPDTEPEWTARDYIPSTWPGSRAPHVFLSNGRTSILALCGPAFTVVDFTATGESSIPFVKSAERLDIPLKRVWLPQEDHLRRIWERSLVLVRPDFYVAWRSAANLTDATIIEGERIEHILLTAVGQRSSREDSQAQDRDHPQASGPSGYHQLQSAVFTTSVGNVEQDAGKIDKMAEFQVQV